jgi:hypothetical protein
VLFSIEKMSDKESVDRSDSEGALLSELGDNNNINNDGLDESEDAVVPVQQRNRWCTLQKFYKVNGRTVVTYPFLMDPNNLKDELLITQLITDEPFAARHGEVKTAWENVANKLKEQKSGGEYIYQKSLCSKTIRDRFTKYVEIVKSYDREVPLHSGDDSEIFYERFGELEKLCSRYLSAASEIDDAKKDTLQKKKNDREAAEAIRKASLGKIRAARTSETLSGSESDSDQSIKYSDQSNKTSSKKKQKKKKAKQSDTAKIGNNVAMFSLILDEREDRMKQKESRLRLKEENRAKELELQQQSLQLQQQRFDAYLKQQEEQTKQQEAQREFMLALAKTFTK